MRGCRAGFTVVLIGMIAGSLNVAGAQGDTTFYAAKVQPILVANCASCHSGMNHRGGLNMDTRANLLKGGNHGPAIVPGNAGNSLLIRLIRHEGPAGDPMDMPKKGEKLSDADIATIAAWINAGALMPR